MKDRTLAQLNRAGQRCPAVHPRFQNPRARRKSGQAEGAVRTWAHQSLLEDDGAAAWDAFCKYREALQTADGIESGEIDWRDYAPYNFGDRKEQAWWDAVGEVDGWMRVLLCGYGSGPIRTTQKAGA